MKRLTALGIIGMILVLLVQVPAGMAGNGYMGGRGAIVVENPPAVEEGDSATDEGGLPDTVEGPLNDKMADAGKLFGDLYKILRYEGGEDSYSAYDITEDVTGYNVYSVTPDRDRDHDGLYDDPPVGGEPVLSNLHGWYVVETMNDDGDIEYDVVAAPVPSQCVQPVADSNKWGDISGRTGLKHNRIPLVITYDATWDRTECEVGELLEVKVDSDTGELDLTINPWFVEPGEEWNTVIYCGGILWTDLVDEVSFGRLNLSRSPEAVLQAAFDEAITAINNAVSISRDAAGRLLLENEIFSETEVDECGNPLQLDNAFKAIDSPLENLALYVKLMKDGHLVTSGDERAPIDRSEKGGIPLWKMLELSDGPSSALRPTIDIQKLYDWDLGSLVDVAPQSYYTYYACYDEGGSETPCLCEGANHDGTATQVACENVVSRKLVAVATCPDPEGELCEGPFTGILTDDTDDDGENDYAAQGDDFDFAAAFLAAAADKTGDIGVDMVVYLNSILGINKVVGYSEYDSDGNPTGDAVNYSEEPVYFSFYGIGVTGSYGPYDREATFGASGGRGDAGQVRVLQMDAADTWKEQEYQIMDIRFDNIGIDPEDGLHNGDIAVSDIRGFAQMADDDLSVIEFVHTYQIPGLR